MLVTEDSSLEVILTGVQTLVGRSIHLNIYLKEKETVRSLSTALFIL